MSLHQRSNVPRRRIARALTALVTVWCLGCDAIDPLLSADRGAGDAMDCAPGATSPAGAERVAAEAVAAPDGNVVSADSAAEEPRSCACQSCIVTAPEVAIARASAALTGDLDVSEPAAPASVSHAPLVPPPQRVLDRA